MVAYEVNYHPAHSTILKYRLIKYSVLDPLQPPDTNIPFISHDLIQSTDAITVKNKLTQQNGFLAETSIVPIFNINENSMNTGTKNVIKKDSLSYHH